MCILMRNTVLSESLRCASCHLAYTIEDGAKFDAFTAAVLITNETLQCEVSWVNSYITTVFIPHYALTWCSTRMSRLQKFKCYITRENSLIFTICIKILIPTVKQSCTLWPSIYFLFQSSPSEVPRETCDGYCHETRVVTDNPVFFGKKIDMHLIAA